MNSALQASKVFVQKQCVRTTFAGKRSFISFSHSAQKGVTCNNRIGLANALIGFQRKNFSTNEKKDDLIMAESLLKGPPSEKVQQLCTDILSLNIVDTHILLNLIQSKLGISDETMASMIGGGGGGGGGGGAAAPVAAEPVKEKDAFDIKLTVVDPKSKIKIIKEVRALTGLGLKEAKDLVEKAPVVIKEGVKKEELDAIKKTLTDAGAVIEIL